MRLASDVSAVFSATSDDCSRSSGSKACAWPHWRRTWTTAHHRARPAASPAAAGMFGVDILRDAAASTPTNDVLYFAVAGKHVPANAMGNGGDAYSWRIDVPV